MKQNKHQPITHVGNLFVEFAPSWFNTRAYSGQPSGAFNERIIKRDQHEIERLLRKSIVHDVGGDFKLSIKYSAVIDPAYRHQVNHNHEFNELLHQLGCFSNRHHKNSHASDRRIIILYSLKEATTEIIRQTVLTVIQLDEQNHLSDVHSLFVIDSLLKRQQLAASQYFVNEQALVLCDRVDNYPELLSPVLLKLAQKSYQKFRNSLKQVHRHPKKTLEALEALRTLLQPYARRKPLRLLLSRNHQQICQLKKIIEMVHGLSILGCLTVHEVQENFKHVLAVKKTLIFSPDNFMRHLLALHDTQYQLVDRRQIVLPKHALIKATVELLSDSELKRLYRRLQANRKFLNLQHYLLQGQQQAFLLGVRFEEALLEKFHFSSIEAVDAEVNKQLVTCCELVKEFIHAIRDSLFARGYRELVYQLPRAREIKSNNKECLANLKAVRESVIHLFTERFSSANSLLKTQDLAEVV